MKKSTELLLSAVIAFIAIVIFMVISHGPSLTVTLVPATILAFVLHASSTSRKLPRKDEIIPIYFVTLAFQFLHFGEEFVTGFHLRFPVEIFSAEPYSPETFVLLNMVIYFFIVAALLVSLRWSLHFPMVIAWFFAVAVMANAIAHPALCLVVGGYFPGLFTSLPFWILGSLLIKRLWQSGSEIHSDGTKTE